MNAPHRDDVLWEAIESGSLDVQSRDLDPDLAHAFDAHQKLEALFDLLRCPARLNRATVSSSTGDTEPNDAVPASAPVPEALGRYRVRGVLGTGGFGTVYLAEDPELRREVAIKVPRAGLFASPQAADAFLEEARSAARLKHAGIVTVHDVGRENGSIYLVLEYVPGRPLDDLIAAGPVDPALAAGLVADVAEALHHAHKLGFVHRDLKPGNILLDGKNRPHVTDFGLAVSEDSQRMLAGQVAGTPGYMSPEQVRGETHRLDGRTDIWSLGVIFYEMLTGRHPFWRGDTKTCFDEILHREPKPPRQIDDRVPIELEQVCLNCLAKSIMERPTSAADVGQQLREWLRRHDGLSAKPTPAVPGRWRSILAVSTVALLILVATAFLLNRPASPRPVSLPVAESIRPKGLAPEVQSLLGMLYSAKLSGKSPTARIEPQFRPAGAPPDAWQPLRNGDTLSSNDSYRVLIMPEQAAYFYVVQIDSSGKVDWLFPKNETSPHSSGVNPVAPADWTHVPEKGRAFYLDESEGVEHLYIVATATRWKEVETAFSKTAHNPPTTGTIDTPFALKTRGVGGLREVVAPATSQATVEAKPVVEGIEGVLVEEVWFNHRAK